MFNKGRRDQLGRIFTLFMRAASETLKEILTRFGSYVEQEGNALFSDPNVCKDPILFTTKVMNLKERIDDSVAQEFNAHILFQRKRDALFSQILNKFEKSPQFIAIYTDYEFKKGLIDLLVNLGINMDLFRLERALRRGGGKETQFRHGIDRLLGFSRRIFKALRSLFELKTVKRNKHQ